MRRFTAALACSLAVISAPVLSAPIKFAFQELQLDMPLAQVPVSYKTDCGNGRDPRFLFCYLLADVGDVRMSIRITFSDERLSDIEVYFPSDQFDVVWLALRQKYGEETSRMPGVVQWLSSPRELGQPIPDQLTLRKDPLRKRQPDGKYIAPNVRYSAIDYESFWDGNQVMKKIQDEHDLKVKGIAEKL